GRLHRHRRSIRTNGRRSHRCLRWPDHAAREACLRPHVPNAILRPHPQRGACENDGGRQHLRARPRQLHPRRRSCRSLRACTAASDGPQLVAARRRRARLRQTRAVQTIPHRLRADAAHAFTQGHLMAHHVFITGGGTGIGLATARALAPTGARFTLVGRDGARAQSAAEEFENGHGLSCDVANEDSVAAAFTAARDRYGPIDILINNAGITPSAPLDRMDLSMWNQCLAINLTGAFLCSRAAITDMYANKWGRIVNVASIAGLQGAAYISAYCASKHGMIGMTRALAKEAAKKGVTV